MNHINDRRTEYTGQKCLVGIVQWAPGTSVSEEIADIFHNYDSDSDVFVTDM